MESCFAPIIQSGGSYDLRASAVSNDANLSSDIVICSLGARYKNYCSNISRTFIVDAPPRVDSVYKTLLKLYSKCLESMIVGKELKVVHQTASAFLKENDPELVSSLPKSLGFSMGLEFRDSNLLLNDSNSNVFVSDMIFNFSIGLDKIPLPENERRGSYAGMQTFSVLIGDTIRIQSDGIPEVLTKCTFEDVFYNIADKV